MHLGGELRGDGAGRSKKEAEQRAAEAAFVALGGAQVATALGGAQVATAPDADAATAPDAGPATAELRA